MPVVITIHGVETLALWFNKIQPALSGIDGLIHCPHTYGDDRLWRRHRKFRVWRAFFDRTRHQAERDFVRLYEAVVSEYREAPSIIAHSFGTYVVAQAFHKYQLEYDAVVLCGSIVDRDFQWDPSRVRRVRNDISGNDRVVRLFRSQWLCRRIPGTGSSGLDGFRNPPRHVEEWRFPQYAHSDALMTKLHCSKRWVPFILGTEEFMKACQDCFTDPLKLHRFDAAYGSVIHREVELLFRNEPLSVRNAARRYVRRLVIDIGRQGRNHAEPLVRKCAYLVRADL
jgi:pimeloyl-ACP methyl ester carboxylesterase